MKYPDHVITGSVLAIALSVGATYFQVQSIARSAGTVDKNRSEFLSKKVSLIAGIDDSDFLNTNYSVFETILGRNSSDSKRKAEWINLLKSAKSQLDLTEMSFDIYPARAITQNQQELLVSISVEIIELKLSLLHDGKLVEFINFLNAHAPNEFVIAALELKRVDNERTAPKMINLEALCTIKWYSIDMIGESDDLQS